MTSPIRRVPASNAHFHHPQPMLPSQPEPASARAPPHEPHALYNLQQPPRTAAGAQSATRSPFALPSPAPSDDSTSNGFAKNGRIQSFRPDGRQDAPFAPAESRPGSYDLSPIAQEDVQNALLLRSRACLQRLGSGVSGLGGISKRQYLLLEGACQPASSSADPLSPVRDLVFLLVHQICCLAVVERIHLPEKILTIPNIELTLDLLILIVTGYDRTDQARVRYSQCFVHLPAPPSLLLHLTEYQTAIAHGVDFIYYLGTNVSSYLKEVQSQPPDPRQIHKFFHCSSPGLQHVVLKWAEGWLEHQRQNMILSSSHIAGPQSTQRTPVADQPQAIPSSGRATFQPAVSATQVSTQAAPQALSRPSPSTGSVGNVIRSPTDHRPNNLYAVPPGPAHQMESYHRRVSFPANGHNSVAHPSRGQVLSIPAASLTQSFAPPPSGSGLPGPYAKPRDYFPPVNVFAAQVPPAEPQRFALHQARLTSPRLVCNETQPSGSGEGHRAYQYVAETPTLEEITHKSIICRWSFQITGPAAARIAKDKVARTPYEHDVRLVDSQSRIYRLRCVKGSPSGYTDTSIWAVADCVWPDHVCFQINGHRLEARRKIGHGRHLPIDVTRYVRKGENVVEAFANMDRNGPAMAFSACVEVVKLALHENIKKSVATRPFSTQGTKEAILGSRKAGADKDVVSPGMKIGLFDPIGGSQMVKIPVRGPRCRHRECFDLETFLQTRPSKWPGDPSMVDEWRCPLCREDARPPVLRVDKWMQEIRKELEAAGKMQTRFIQVESDGSWKAIEEKENTPSVPATAEAHSGKLKQISNTRPVEIIDIDSD